MTGKSDLEWPFFDDGHRAFAAEVERALDAVPAMDDEGAVAATCRAWVRALAGAGILRACVPEAYGGLRRALDVRSLSVARERLAYRSALADFAFAMQGLGSGAIALFGSDDLCRRSCRRSRQDAALRPLRCPSAKPVLTSARS